MDYVIFYHGTWSEASRSVKQKLDRHKGADSVEVREVDVDKATTPPTYDGQLIRSLPFLVRYENGRPVDHLVGDVPEDAVRRFIARTRTKTAFWDGFEKAARKLTSKARNALTDDSFVFPGERRYPIHDINHARNALARVAQNGSPSEQSAVRSAVHQKYPELKED
jgi:hypothetical protein